MFTFEFLLSLANLVIAARAKNDGSQAALNAISKATQLYNEMREEARQSRELTADQESWLDEKAELVFGGAAADPNING
jgi:hypothetical protein